MESVRSLGSCHASFQRPVADELASMTEVGSNSSHGSFARDDVASKACDADFEFVRFVWPSLSKSGGDAVVAVIKAVQAHPT